MHNAPAVFLHLQKYTFTSYNLQVTSYTFTIYKLHIFLIAIA